MNPSTFYKQPWELRTLVFDVSDALATGDTLASISVIKMYDSAGTDVSDTMISGTPAIATSTTVTVKVQGGTNGSYYWLTLRLITTNGDKVEDDLKIIVKSRGT